MADAWESQITRTTQEIHKALVLIEKHLPQPPELDFVHEGHEGIALEQAIKRVGELAEEMENMRT